MSHRLILNVLKFQLPPAKRFDTLVKNILGGHHGAPCQIGLSNRLISDIETHASFTTFMK